MTATLASVDEVLLRAVSQEGYVESGGPDHHSGNVVRFWPDDGWAQYQGGSWCAAFITWLFLPWADMTWIRYLNVVVGEDMFRRRGKFFTDPKGIRKGDILFYHFPGEAAGANHTGIALEDANLANSTVHAIEGNTSSDDKGSQINGGGVYEKHRALSLVHGYGRPDYSTVVPPPPLNDFRVPGARGFVDAPNGAGGWVYAADGGVFTVGAANFYGSMGGKVLNAPVVGGAVTPTGKGYWLVASDGGIFAFGDAPFEGSMGGKPLNAPITAMASTRSGKGYWLTGADGGVFAYGDAIFAGSMAGRPLAAPVGWVEPTSSGKGYWLAGKDGGIFAFGDAPSAGSMAGRPMAAPLVGLVRSRTGQGYALVGADGGVFNFGDAAWQPYAPLLDQYAKGERSIVGADTTPNGTGLELVSDRLETYVL